MTATWHLVFFFRATDLSYVRRFLVPRILTHPPESIIFGLLEPYRRLHVSLPPWAFVQPSASTDPAPAFLGSILPSLGAIIRELAVSYSDLHQHVDTILLMTDTRDWTELPGGAGLLAALTPRIRLFAAERRTLARY